jgi:hypothetical protein
VPWSSTFGNVVRPSLFTLKRFIGLGALEFRAALIIGGGGFMGSGLLRISTALIIGGSGCGPSWHRRSRRRGVVVTAGVDALGYNWLGCGPSWRRRSQRRGVVVTAGVGRANYAIDIVESAMRVILPRSISDEAQGDLEAAESP